MTDLLAYFTERTPEMLERLIELVEIETPTPSKPDVDRLGEHLTTLCRELGGAVTTYPREQVGDLRIAVWNADAPGKPIMLLCHMDTVWPLGTLSTMPVREDSGLLFGPGVADMKGGIVVALEAIRGLRDRGELPNRPIWIFFNSDEETGSLNSRALIHEKAAEVGLVLVMEPATAEEAFKAWRKGFARYTITAHGRASHAGQAPENGINAVIEAAHQAIFLHSLNDYPNGTSVSVTTVQGGSAINVIPAEAVLGVDVRFLKMSEAQRVDQAIRTLTPVLPGAQLAVEGGIDRGPMERDAQMIRVVQQAQALGRALDMELPEDGSGGGSDGNFTAALGIPTLDGLGPAGLGLHAAHEQLQIRTLPRRAALLAKILTDWDMSLI